MPDRRLLASIPRSHLEQSQGTRGQWIEGRERNEHPLAEPPRCRLLPLSSCRPADAGAGPHPLSAKAKEALTRCIADARDPERPPASPPPISLEVSPTTWPPLRLLRPYDR